MIVAGIDPGKTGALFVMGEDGLHDLCDVPCAMMKVAGKKSKRAVPLYDQWFKQWATALHGVQHVFIEQVGGGRIGGQKQAGSSMFSFGRSLGFVEALVISAGIPYTFVTPQQWRKVAGLTGKPDGNKSRARASQLLPSLSSWWPLVKHDGRAEAALLAWAGKQIVEGKESGTTEPDGRRSHRRSKAR